MKSEAKADFLAPPKEERRRINASHELINFILSIGLANIIATS
jgi:hypothetical protein